MQKKSDLCFFQSVTQRDAYSCELFIWDSVWTLSTVTGQGLKEQLYIFRSLCSDIMPHFKGIQASLQAFKASRWSVTGAFSSLQHAVPVTTAADRVILISVRHFKVQFTFKAGPHSPSHIKKSTFNTKIQTKFIFPFIWQYNRIEILSQKQKTVLVFRFVSLTPLNMQWHNLELLNWQWLTGFADYQCMKISFVFGNTYEGNYMWPSLTSWWVLPHNCPNTYCQASSSWMCLFMSSNESCVAIRQRANVHKAK